MSTKTFKQLLAARASAEAEFSAAVKNCNEAQARLHRAAVAMREADSALAHAARRLDSLPNLDYIGRGDDLAQAEAHSRSETC